MTTDLSTTLPDEIEQLIAQLPTLEGEPGPYIADQAQDDLDELGAGIKPRQPKDAVALGREWVAIAFWCGVGYCLKTIRSLAGVAALYPDATTAWDNAKQRHLETDPMKIPWGVFVWWVNDGHGHVAYGLGRGRCLTTDYVKTGFLGVANIADLGPWCRGTLAGWSEDINDVDVWDPPATPWGHEERVKHLEQALQRAIRHKAPRRRIRGLRRWLREEKSKP